MVNVVLFVITAQKLKETAEQTRFATKSKAKVTDRLVLYMKLIAILGFTWIFWFIALFTQTPIFTYPTIFLHGLNGAFIFVAFTVKRNVYRLVVLRIKYLRGRHKRINTTIRRLHPQIRRPSANPYTCSKSEFTVWNDPFQRSRLSSIVWHADTECPITGSQSLKSSQLFSIGIEFNISSKKCIYFRQPLCKLKYLLLMRTNASETHTKMTLFYKNFLLTNQIFVENKALVLSKGL